MSSGDTNCKICLFLINIPPEPCNWISHDLLNKLTDVSDVGHGETGNCKIQINEIDEVPYLMELFKQSYNEKIWEDKIFFQTTIINFVINSNQQVNMIEYSLKNLNNIWIYFITNLFKFFFINTYINYLFLIFDAI